MIFARPQSRRAFPIRARFALCLLGSATFAAGLPAPAGAVVLVVKSDGLEQYDAPIRSFKSGVTESTRVIDIEGSRRRGGERLRAVASRTDTSDAEPVDAVFALGGQAAYLSRRALPTRPMVFAMVLDWQRYEFTAPAAGISVEIPVDSLFTRFKLLLPGIERLGLIHGGDLSPATLLAAREAAAVLSIELIVESVKYSESVPGAYRRLRRDVDALWMLPDPLVVTLDNFRYLRDRTRRDGVAFLAFSENFVRAGALLSIAPSYRTMGAQAAALLDELRAQPSLTRTAAARAGEIRVQQPMGSKLVINADAAQDLGIELDAALLSMADVVVRDTAPAR